MQDSPFIIRGGLLGDRLRRLVGQRRVRNILFAAGGERQRERRGKQQRKKSFFMSFLLCFFCMSLLYHITKEKSLQNGYKKGER